MLLIVNQNPAAADVLVVVTMAITAGLGLFVLGIWLVVARGQARRDEAQFNDSAANPDLQRLRRRRLVLRGRRSAGSREGAVTAQLEPTEPATPRRRTGG